MTSRNAQGYGSFPYLICLFFLWGFITCLNDILIPHLKAVFDLSFTQAILVQFCFFSAYFLVSIPSGWLIKRIGYKHGIVLGLTIAAFGCIMFYPATVARSYPVFLSAFFILASGITLLQVSANPYVTISGPAETASSRLTLTQAFNSLGTTIAPYLGSILILSVAIKLPDELSQLSIHELAVYHDEQALSVQIPYLVLACILFILAVFFWFFPLPDITGKQNKSTHKQSLWTLFKFKHLSMGVIAIFLYVGAEVSIGSFLVNYLTQPHVSVMSLESAGQLVSIYWGGAMIGRFLGAAVLSRAKPGLLLSINAFFAILLLLISMNTVGLIAIWTILLVGLFNSIMFPTIFSMSLTGLGRLTGEASGLLCTAIVGGAIVPIFHGMLADKFGLQYALFSPVLCYGFILFYGYSFRKLSVVKN